MSKKLIVSKINEVGSMRQIPEKTFEAGGLNRSNNIVGCSDENDLKTKYIKDRSWNVEIQTVQYIPYFECGYIE